MPGADAKKTKEEHYTALPGKSPGSDSHRLMSWLTNAQEAEASCRALWDKTEGRVE